MKQLLALILMLAVLLGSACCSEIETQPDSADLSPEDAIIQQLMTAIGPELMERAKAGGYTLSVKFRNYEFVTRESWTPSEKDNTEDVRMISVEILSPNGSTMYGNNTVDVELMKALQYAVIDSGIFGLAEADAAALKERYYTVETRYTNTNVIAEDGAYVELHIDETPFGNSVICYVRHLNRHAQYSSLTNIGHRENRAIRYQWDELQP